MSHHKSTHFRKQLYLFLLISICTCMFSSLPVSAASAKLNKTLLTLSTYHTYQLKVSHASSVKWSSSNSAIAAVSGKGLVTANAAGKAKIYAKVGKKRLTCKITVVEYDRHIERAAYGSKVIRDFLGDSAVISGYRYGNFMNSTEFSYFVCSYINAKGKHQTCYVYIYPQEERSVQQLNVKTTIYGNLVVKIDSLEMERMMQDRSKTLKESTVKKCLSILEKYEKIKYTKGKDFKASHSWMNL